MKRQLFLIKVPVINMIAILNITGIYLLLFSILLFVGCQSEESVEIPDKDVKFIPIDARALCGTSEILRAGRVPSSVGMWLWENSETNRLFIDLVNYNYNPDTDTVKPLENIRFWIRFPAGSGPLSIQVLDEQGEASLSVHDGWAEVTLNYLATDAIIEISG